MIKDNDIRVEVGKIPKNRQKGVIYFSNFAEMNEILNARRVELLNAVKEKHPESIYELAKILNRDQGNVTRDVNVLYKYGFLDIKKQKKGDRIKSKPEYDSEGIQMVIKIGAGAFGLAKDILEGVSEEFKGKNLDNNKEYTKKNISEATNSIKNVIKKAAKKLDIVVKE